MREKVKGHPVSVSIGYGKQKDLKNEKIILIKNLKDLKKIKKDYIGKIGKIGNKKKIEIIKKAKEMKIKIWKTNTEKFLKSHQKKGIKKTENKNKENKK